MTPWKTWCLWVVLTAAGWTSVALVDVVDRVAVRSVEGASSEFRRSEITRSGDEARVFYTAEAPQSTAEGRLFCARRVGGAWERELALLARRAPSCLATHDGRAFLPMDGSEGMAVVQVSRDAGAWGMEVLGDVPPGGAVSSLRVARGAAGEGAIAATGLSIDGKGKIVWLFRQHGEAWSAPDPLVKLRLNERADLEGGDIVVRRVGKLERLDATGHLLSEMRLNAYDWFAGSRAVGSDLYTCIAEPGHVIRLSRLGPRGEEMLACLPDASGRAKLTSSIAGALWVAWVSGGWLRGAELDVHGNVAWCGDLLPIPRSEGCRLLDAEGDAEGRLLVVVSLSSTYPAIQRLVLVTVLGGRASAELLDRGDRGLHVPAALVGLLGRQVVPLPASRAEARWWSPEGIVLGLWLGAVAIPVLGGGRRWRLPLSAAVAWPIGALVERELFPDAWLAGTHPCLVPVMVFLAQLAAAGARMRRPPRTTLLVAMPVALLGSLASAGALFAWRLEPLRKAVAPELEPAARYLTFGATFGAVTGILVAAMLRTPPASPGARR